MRANPNEWSRYTTASIAMKIIRSKQPTRLHECLKQTFYCERRNAGKGLFFDSSKTKAGRQSLQNRLLHIKQVVEPWSEQGFGLTNDKIRILLKHTFFMCYAQIRIVPLPDPAIPSSA